MWKTNDPQGRPTVTAGSDHYFHTCPSVRPSPILKISQNKTILSENNDRWTVSLAGRIIDDTHVIFLFLFLSTYLLAVWHIFAISSNFPLKIFFKVQLWQNYAVSNCSGSKTISALNSIWNFQ